MRVAVDCVVRVVGQHDLIFLIFHALFIFSLLFDRRMPTFSHFTLFFMFNFTLLFSIFISILSLSLPPHGKTYHLDWPKEKQSQSHHVGHSFGLRSLGLRSLPNWVGRDALSFDALSDGLVGFSRPFVDQ